MTERVRGWLRSTFVVVSIAAAAFAGSGAFLGGASSATVTVAMPRTSIRTCPRRRHRRPHRHRRSSSSSLTPSPREVEIELIERVNALRIAEHLRPLAEDRPDLTTMARSWAASMAQDGGISHRRDLTTAAPADWTKVGENVGVGDSIATLHEAFVASPMHYRNLVDPEFETIAVGVVVRGDRIWVTQNFMQAAPAGTTPDDSTVELTAPPGGLGRVTCVTADCESRHQ